MLAFSLISNSLTGATPRLTVGPIVVNVETVVAGLKIGSGLAVVLVVDGVTNNGATGRGGTVVTLTSML